MVVVPLYDTLGPGAIRYIVNTGKIKTDAVFSILWLRMVCFLLLKDDCRILEWFVLEGTLKFIWFQLLSSAGTHFIRPGCSKPHPTWP